MAATTAKSQAAAWPDKKEDYELLDVIGEIWPVSRIVNYTMHQS